jgi:hypothetical protein
MGQISMKISALPGSVLSENQQNDVDTPLTRGVVAYSIDLVDTLWT